MTTGTLAAPRHRSWRLTLTTATLLVAVSACSSPGPTPPASQPVGSVVASVPASAPTAPTPTPAPTVPPTPLYTNPPDAQLLAVIPARVGGRAVVKPAPSEFGITPGDIAQPYGDLGLRFRSLAIAFVEPRLLSLYAMRVDGASVTTAQLEPYLAAAGEYVGIQGLHREPWKLVAAGGHLVWQRPEDNATATGTMIYTWAAGDLVFLMLGRDAAVNRAMLAALPGEPPPSPSPQPSTTPAASGSDTPAASPSATP